MPRTERARALAATALLLFAAPLAPAAPLVAALESSPEDSPRASPVASPVASPAALPAGAPAAQRAARAGGAKGANKDRAGGAPEIVDPPASPGGFDLPAYTRAVLPNGLVVLLMEQKEVPVVAMQLTVESGASADPRGKEGLAALTADLLTAGTATRSAEQIANDVDALGGRLSATADADTSALSSEFLSRDADRQLDLMADVALRPAFAPAEVDRVKKQRVAEIVALPDNARAFADAQFEAAVFAGSPYGHTPLGLRAAVESVSPADAQGFYRANYAPNNAVLAVVGDFRTDDMLAKVRAAFGGWTRGAVTRSTFAPPQLPKGRRVVAVDYPGLSQTQVRIGSIGIARNDPDYAAVQVASTALGSGFSSRLVDEIRVNKSLTYNIGSRFSARQQPGAFLISTFTKNKTTREIVDATFAVLNRFRTEPITPAELERAKSFYLGRYALGLESPAGLAATITATEVYGLPRDNVETLAGRVRALTVADITAAARKHFAYDDVTIVLFTNLAETRPQLEGLGALETRSATP